MKVNQGLFHKKLRPVLVFMSIKDHSYLLLVDEELFQWYQ
jgi:hypothetical protein